MKALHLFCLELGRLFQSRLTWLVILLTVLSPLAGLVLYKPTAADTMLSMYLADPALAGGVVGGILFGLLTVYELDRTERSRVGMLMDAAVPPDHGPGAPARPGRCRCPGSGPHHAGLAPHQPGAHRLRLWRHGLPALLSAVHGAGPVAGHSGGGRRLSVHPAL